MTKFRSDALVSKYLDKAYKTEMKPMMTTLVEKGKQQGYINTGLPDEVIVLYLDVTKQAE